MNASSISPSGSYRPQRPEMRLGIAIALSLFAHGLLLSLQFGMFGPGLPRLELPWSERRVQAAGLSVRIAGARKPAQEENGAIPAATVPAPLEEAPAGSSPGAGNTRMQLRIAPLPAATPPQPAMATKAPKKRPAASPRRIARSKPQVRRPKDVVALNAPRQDALVMPAPALDEIEPPKEPPASAADIAEPVPAETPTVVPQEDTPAEQPADAAEAQQQQAERHRLAEDETVALQRQEETQRQEQAEREALELQARRQAEEDARRQQAELALQREHEEAARRAQLEARLREEAQREAMELEARRQAEEAALAQRRQEEEEALRRQAEADALRREQERAAQERLAAQRLAADNAATAARAAGHGRAPLVTSLPKDLSGGDLASRALQMAKQPETMRSAPDATAAPRRRSIFGGGNIDAGLMMYIESWRLKIERNGRLNYAQSARDKARGDPVVTVSIRSDGSVEDVVINRPSGHPAIDDAVRRIVRLNERYSAFPPNLARQYDVIEIRRVWSFDDVLRILEDVR